MTRCNETGLPARASLVNDHINTPEPQTIQILCLLVQPIDQSTYLVRSLASLLGRQNLHRVVTIVGTEKLILAIRKLLQNDIIHDEPQDRYTS